MKQPEKPFLSKSEEEFPIDITDLKRLQDYKQSVIDYAINDPNAHRFKKHYNQTIAHKLFKEATDTDRFIKKITLNNEDIIRFNNYQPGL